MRETIICIGKTGAEPYTFPETGVRVFSYEEICYYLSRHMIFYIKSLPEEELLYYMKNQLGLDKLYRQLCRLTDPEKDQMKYFSALFREGNYFSEEDIHKILDEYRELKNASPALAGKWTGDLYFRYKKTSMAAACYCRALREDTKDEFLQGNIYHNLAAAKARLFRFHDAKIDFLKAYQLTGEEESLFGYYCVTALVEGEETALHEMESFQISELSQESFEHRYASVWEEYRDSEAADRVKRMTFLEEQGRKEEAEKVSEKLIRSMQNDFRKEAEI